jgi:glycosyltransferase involved in cell wall biosynthesis
MAEKISIIVPVYNTENYLRRCVDSLLKQTWADIEAILVDDGSTDGSGAICDEYAAACGRVLVLHQPNGGEASARQAGLAAAGGEYVMFSDTDDEYLPGAAEKLVSAMTGDVGLAVGEYIEKAGGVTRYASTNRQSWSVDELIVNIFTDHSPYGTSYIMSTVNGKLFRNSVIRENGLAFNSRYRVGNDTLFICDYLKRVKRVFDIYAPVYVYYKYDPRERLQGMAWMYPDAYKLPLERANRLLDAADVPESVRGGILLAEFDGLIRGLVWAAAYEEYFPGGIEAELIKVLEDPLVRAAGALYKRTRLSDSRLIPFAIKRKLPRLLLYALRRRARSYLAAAGKAASVRLITVEIGAGP